MPQNIIEIKGKEAGKDIYVVGSGKSIDYIPVSFWEGKTVIGVNSVAQHIPCQYVLSHHYFVLQPFIDAQKYIVVTSHSEMGIMEPIPDYHLRPVWYHERLTGEFYVYRHLQQGFTKINLSVFDTPGYLVTGGSIITTALHFAYFLGAKNILLLGVDGGMLDGEMNFTGYSPKTNTDHPINARPQLEQMADHIRGLGVPVISINPFINMTLEGHTFEANPKWVTK